MENEQTRKVIRISKKKFINTVIILAIVLGGLGYMAYNFLGRTMGVSQTGGYGSMGVTSAPMMDMPYYR